MKYFLKTVLLFTQLWTAITSTSSPHIIFIYADDLGWNDISLHGSPEIPTPNIDALAMSGILLNNYYGYWMCTPSRAALLTGINPIRLGLQHFVLKSAEASGLPLNVKTLPEYLKNLGYENHIVGKWHLGYMTNNYLPKYRKFDSFFGYVGGYIDYYDYVKNGRTGLSETPFFYGIDLYNITDVIRNFRGKYATEVFTEKAKEIIRLHDASKPLFLYLSHLAVHNGNSYKPLQAPPKYVKSVSHIKDPKRRIFAGTVVALDESVGQIFEVLNEKNMLENSIILFVSDNGAAADHSKDEYGSNFPLRGRKETLWEGGNRLPAVIWSPLFQLEEPRISSQLMHVTDWTPTLYRAAGGDLSDLKDIDGINMWDALMENLPSPRTEILYNIDPIESVSALRNGDMKVINGSNKEFWYNPTENSCFDYNFGNCNFVTDSVVERILRQNGRWIVHNQSLWRKQSEVVCHQSTLLNNCNPVEKPCLFNVTEDPCEYNNLADEYPEIVKEMMESIYDYQKTAVEPQSKPSDPRGNPDCHDFAFVPWMEPENYDACAEYYSQDMTQDIL